MMERSLPLTSGQLVNHRLERMMSKMDLQGEKQHFAHVLG